MSIPHFRRFLAFSLIGSVTLMPLLILPGMIGVLVDNAGMSDSSAGWSATAHFFAAAVIGLAMAVRVHHINLQQATRIALVIAVAADVGSALTAGDNTSFFVARIVAGIALGVAYVSSVTAFARFEGYERGFGLFVTLQFIISGVGLYLVPVFADDIGAQGLFFVLAGMDAMALMLAGQIPSERAVPDTGDNPASELAILFTACALFAIIGFTVFEAANNAQFAFVERFGVSLGFSDHEIGLSMLVASLLGIPGAFGIVLLGQRLGTLGPLVAGISLAVIGQLILIYTHSYSGYFVGSCFMGFSWAFCLPYIQTLLAGIDRKGSAIAAGSSLSTFGSAAGPGLAAVVVLNEQYTHVFILSIALFVIASLAFVGAVSTRKRVQ